MHCYNRPVALLVIAWFVWLPSRGLADGDPGFYARQVAAAGQQASETESPRRVFTPPAASNVRTVARRAPGDLFKLPKIPVGSTAATLGAMGVVIGLFLLSIWLVRRGMPAGHAPLPDGVVRVLGRKPLAGRQSAQLMQVGNKLLLVAITADGVRPLTEVTDPIEVDRLLGLCAQSHTGSSSTAFDEILQQLASEPAGAGIADEVPSAGRSALSAQAYLESLGGQRRA